jgi:hypothetical protein
MYQRALTYATPLLSWAHQGFEVARWIIERVMLPLANIRSTECISLYKITHQYPFKIL